VNSLHGRFHVLSWDIPNGFVGLNKVVLDEAIENGAVQGDGKKSKLSNLEPASTAFSRSFKFWSPWATIGGGKPELGVKVCLEGVTDKAKRKIAELQERRKKANKTLIPRLYRERLKETDHTQLFAVGDVYKGMGAKVIGLIKPNKYIFGIVNVSSDIPGWRRLEKMLGKACIRVPESMQAFIDQGKKPGAVDLLMKTLGGIQRPRWSPVRRQRNHPNR